MTRIGIRAIGIALFSFILLPGTEAFGRKGRPLDQAPGSRKPAQAAITSTDGDRSLNRREVMILKFQKAQRDFWRKNGFPQAVEDRIKD